MIPKKIHYCWFGKNPLPESVIKMIESWKKYCPDYEIIEWNESNFDVTCCDYVKEAYEAKKWAFVSDYARFKILYENGGLYFDTDVEILRSFDDIIEKGSFMGWEDKDVVNPGLGLGAEAGMDFYRRVLDGYHNRHFKNPDGTLDLTTVGNYITPILTECGLEKNNTFQTVCSINIYPIEYFRPYNYYTEKLTLTNNSHSIHHYSASWQDKQQHYCHKLKCRFIKFLPRKIAFILATAVAKLKFEGFSATVKWIFKKRK